MLIDAHIHLDRYEAELDAALQEIVDNRIFSISNSMDVPSYRRNLEIGERCPLVLPTFGIHPWNVSQYANGLNGLDWAMEQSPIYGEIGLDYHFIEDASQYPAERAVLEFFLRAAKEQNKIVNLHTKGAEEDVLRLLERYNIQRAIVHWYSGPLDIFRKLASRGAYFTFGPELWDSEHIQALAMECPIGRLLTETDNAGHRLPDGSVRMPLLVRDVVTALAGVRGITVESMIETVESNLLRLIRDDPWLSDTYAKVFAGQGSGE